jgi:ribosomal protein S18 acetylase RimI-like enzyme
MAENYHIQRVDVVTVNMAAALDGPGERTRAVGLKRVLDTWPRDLYCYELRRGTDVRAAAVILGQPGTTALLLLSPDWPGQADAAMARLLRRGAGEALASGIRLIQCFLSVDDERRGRVLSQAGIRRLCEMVYMHRPIRPEDADEPEAGHEARWVSLDQMSDPDRLGRVILATYEGTLDCPEISGLLSAEQILAVHRGQGRHLLRCWWVVCAGGRDVGCVLINRAEEPQVLELIYLGVLPEARGQGWGRRLLAGAIAQSARLGADRLRLAVDARNAPAVGLYREAGFLPIGRRMVHVATAAG